MAVSLSNHPARLAAIAAGEKRFLAVGFPCKRNPKHVTRYAERMNCVECSRKADEARGRVEKRDLPTIGGDFDARMTDLKLIAASTEFLRLLHLEALASVRTKRHDEKAA